MSAPARCSPTRRSPAALPLAAAWLLLFTFAARAPGQPDDEVPPPEHFHRYGYLNEDSTISGLEFIAWKPRGGNQGGPDRVYLGVRNSITLTRPMKVRLLQIQGAIAGQRADVELPPMEIVLPQGSGGPRGKFHVVPLVFPGSVSSLSVNVSNRGRWGFAYFSWWSQHRTFLLRVTPDWQEIHKLRHRLGRADPIHPLLLPPRWPLLAGYSVVAIDLPVLQDLRQRRRRAMQALQNWVLCGGQLLVRAQVPDDPQATAELLQQLALQLSRQKPSAFRPGGPVTVTVVETASEGIPRLLAEDLKLVEASDLPPVSTEEAKKLRRRAARLAEAKLPAARLGAGLLVLVPQQLWEPQEMAIVVQSPEIFLAPGTSPQPGQRDSAGMFGQVDSQFRIPELGNPPVFVFLGLISAFVLVVGPLNYFWFRYRGALHRLFFTVPGTALLATATLLGYVFWSEGLDHKGRFISVTRLDLCPDKAISWAKGAYFSAIPPRQGLQFPWDTAVFLVPPSPSGLFQVPAVQYRQDSHRQVFGSGWLYPRQFSRVLLARVANTERHLQFSAVRADGETPRLTNRLDTRVLLLLAKDARGRLWWARDVERGRTVPLRVHGAQERVATQITSRLLASLSRGNFGDRSRDILTMDDPIARLFQRELPNALAWHLHQVFRWLDRGASRLPPGRWVAIVEHNPEISTGVPLHQRESFHLMIGRWP